MKRISFGCLVVLCLTACSDENNSPPKMDMISDMRVDMIVDASSDMMVDQGEDMSAQTGCVVSTTSASGLSLGSTHQWAVTLMCEAPLQCVQPGCVTLIRDKFDGQKTLVSTTTESIASTSPGHWYTVRFEQLQGPDASVDENGVYTTTGQEPMSLMIEGMTPKLDVSVRWHLGDDIIKSLNMPDSTVYRWPSLLRGGRLMGVQVLDRTPGVLNETNTAPLFGVIARADRVEMIKQLSNKEAEVVATVMGDPASWTSPYFDAFERIDGGQSVYWRAFDVTQKTWSGVIVEVAADGSHQVAGTWNAPSGVERIDPQTVVSIAQEDRLWNMAHRQAGGLALVQTIRSKDGAPQTNALDVRLGVTARQLEQNESAGLAASINGDPLFWFAKVNGGNIEVRLVPGTITPQVGDDTVQLGTATASLSLEKLTSLDTLSVERLVQPDGVTVGLVFHDGAHVIVVQPDGKGQWSKTARLDAPSQIHLGVEPDQGVTHSSSSSFVLEGHHLVALGRWPWNWREKLTSQTPTFIVQWDLRDESMLGTMMARRGPNIASSTIGTLRPARLNTQSISGVGQGGFLDNISCTQVGDCYLLDALPSGAQLYLKGGPKGATLAGAKYGDILIDGVPLEFDLIRPLGAAPSLASTPTLLHRSAGGAFVVLPVWEDGGADPTHRLWLMNEDGTLIKTKASIDVSTSGDADVLRSPARTIDGDLALLVKAQTKLNEITYQLISNDRLADAEVNPSSEMTISPTLGTLVVQNAGAHVVKQHGFGQSQPVFARGPGWLSLDGVAFNAQSNTTKVASVPKNNGEKSLWMFGHQGTDCGELTLSQATILTGEIKAASVWTLAGQASDCTDTEAILGTGQFLAHDHAAILTYHPKNRALTLTYLIEQPDALDVMRTTLATLPAPVGKLTFALADANGDGLTDILVDGQWDDGVRVVKSLGDTTASVVALQTINTVFQTPTSAPTPAPNLFGPPNPQFTTMSSAGTQSTNVGGFLKVVVGNASTCALRTNGLVDCWGTNMEGQTSPPQDVFTDISSGQNHVCGIKSDGRVLCWGRNVEQQLNAPSDVFKTINGGQGWHCGIKADDTVTCWGRQSAHLPGTFVDVQVGSTKACGQRVSGEVVCWDETGSLVTTNTAPAGPFSDYDIAFNNAGCGVQGGALVCWPGMLVPTPPVGTFKQVTLGFGHACAIQSDDKVLCWGHNNNNQQLNAPTDTFVQISTYGQHTCGVTTDGRVLCWGRNDAGEATVPVGKWLDVFAGAWWSCGRRIDQTVQCWGFSTTSPGGPFEQIGVGGGKGIGRRSNGDLVFWNNASTGRVHSQLSPSQQFTSAYRGACSIKTDQSIACLSAGIRPPQGALASKIFTKISGYIYVTCALDVMGEAHCWDRYGQMKAGALPGPWVEISKGSLHACALRADGHVGCWIASQNPGQIPDPDVLTVPATTFTQITSGNDISCGVKTDKTLQCWGRNRYGALNVPSGQFLSVHAHWDSICATRVDRTAVCWGLNTNGQLNVPN